MKDEQIRQQIKEAFDEGYSRKELVKVLKAEGVSTDKIKFFIGTVESTPGGQFKIKKKHILAVIVFVFALLFLIGGAGLIILGTVLGGS